MPTVPSYRIGLIVPSSNVTMETEIPALLRAYESVTGLSFTFHGARMRMKQVTAVALLAMDREADTPRALKIVGALSLFSWFAVLYCGRMLPYLGTGN